MILNKSCDCFISHTGDRDHLKEGGGRKREGEGRKGEGEGERGREKGSPLYPLPISMQDYIRSKFTGHTSERQSFTMREKWSNVKQI